MKEEIESPYDGPMLEPQEEERLLRGANYHEAARYVRKWQLTQNGEEILLGNCRPDVIEAYFEKFSLRSKSEALLIKRKDSRLIQAYVKKYPLCHDAQALLVQEARKEDVLCLVGTKFPLYSDVVEMLPSRGTGILEAYLAPSKLRVI